MTSDEAWNVEVDLTEAMCEDDLEEARFGVPVECD
jgi:hypothetical protein